MAFAATGFAHTSTPCTQALPASGRRSPVAIDSVVVLPAPFGPTSPKNEPCGTTRSTPATACHFSAWITGTVKTRCSSHGGCEQRGVTG